MFFDKVGLETLGAEATARSGDSAPAGRPATPLRASSTARLGGRVSRLRDWSAGAEGVVADAVRATFGLTAAEMDD